ncbi:MAG: hypothetical protein QUU85_06080, partial [Candidatus Eisenbacteria bacterium]|nr:hypothetical protein [Candidatus Eisenbacteria bacterium]
CLVGSEMCIRDRGGGRAPELTAWAARLTVPQTAFTIRTITLFESDLRPEGPVYTPLAIAHPRVPGEGTAGDRDRSDPANEP